MLISEVLSRATAVLLLSVASPLFCLVLAARPFVELPATAAAPTCSDCRLRVLAVLASAVACFVALVGVPLRLPVRLEGVPAAFAELIRP